MVTEKKCFLCVAVICQTTDLKSACLTTDDKVEGVIQIVWAFSRFYPYLTFSGTNKPTLTVCRFKNACTILSSLHVEDKGQTLVVLLGDVFQFLPIIWHDI